MKMLLIALSILDSPPVQSNVDAQVNAIYERIAEKARQRDPLLSRHTYAPDAVFMDERRPGMHVGDELHDSMRGSMQSLRDTGAQARINYRIVRRTLGDNSVIDAGYYRVAITPADRETPPSTTYRKFLVIAERRGDGVFHITHDASLPSSQEAYDGARRVEGLKYDSE